MTDKKPKEEGQEQPKADEGVQQEETQAEAPKNHLEALKQLRQDTEDRLEAEAEERKQQADEAKQRRDAAIQREKDLRV